MALADSSVAITAGAGTTIAASTISGKQHQIVIQADASGHVLGTLPTYFYCSPPSVVGGSKLHLDLFNATGSGKIMDIRGLWIIPKTDATVTGAVASRIDIYRTSTVGTGGTAGATDSATPDVAGGNFTKFDESNTTIPAQITARLIPTGGATISRWMFPNFVPMEEAATSMAYISQFQNLIPVLTFGQKLVVRENTGLLFKQGSVASVGSLTFLIAFTLE